MRGGAQRPGERDATRVRLPPDFHPAKQDRPLHDLLRSGEKLEGFIKGLTATPREKETRDDKNARVLQAWLQKNGEA